MFVATRALVLHKTKYADNGMVVKLFTQKFGTQTFIIKNAYSVKNKRLLPLFSPLSMLEIQFDDRKINQLMYFKEVTCYYQYQDLPCDMVKSSLLLFYCELLYRLLYESGIDEQLYDFLENYLQQLDQSDGVRADAHILFMLRMSQILGFAPNDNRDQTHPYFSIEQSSFVMNRYDNDAVLSQEASEVLSQMISGTLSSPAVKTIRKELLSGMIRYYQRHNEQIRKIESVAILAEIMSN